MRSAIVVVSLMALMVAGCVRRRVSNVTCTDVAPHYLIG